MSRIPIIIATTNGLSGVTSWTDLLRSMLADHPRYQPRTLYVGYDRTVNCDIRVPNMDAAWALVRHTALTVVLPNYIWELFLTGQEPGVFCIGMCHADCEDQYYLPLHWYEPMISRFIAVSNECAKQLAQRIPYRSSDVVTLPYGIAVPPILGRDYQTAPLRLIYAGRVTQLQKRVWDFVPLVEKLIAAKVPFSFDIVGEGDEFEPLQQAMQARFPADVVRFCPRVSHEDMPATWSAHDIFIQVSDFEGTSVSLLEAMAWGVVPVVTAASSGIDGVVHHDVNGFVVPVGDMDAMARTIARLAASHSKLAEAGRAAHQAAQAFSISVRGKQFVQILDEMIAAGHDVDIAKRYGRHAPLHPIIRQKQLIADQQAQIACLKQGLIKRMVSNAYDNLAPSNLRPKLQKIHHKLTGRHSG